MVSFFKKGGVPTARVPPCSCPAGSVCFNSRQARLTQQTAYAVSVHPRVLTMSALTPQVVPCRTEDRKGVYFSVYRARHDHAKGFCPGCNLL
jgi:hypothetical protein